MFMAKRPTEIQKAPKTQGARPVLSPEARALKVKRAIDKAFQVHRDALEELAARDSDPLARPPKK
jgi:hypothetical protein